MDFRYCSKNLEQTTDDMSYFSDPELNFAIILEFHIKEIKKFNSAYIAFNLEAVILHCMGVIIATFNLEPIFDFNEESKKLKN